MRTQVFDYTVNLLQVILWKYDKAGKLKRIIAAQQAYMQVNQTEFWQNWYDNVFNLVTANVFGLSVWSYLMNLPLYLGQGFEPNTKPLWGVNAYTDPTTLKNSYYNFSGANFSTFGTVIRLTPEQQRFLLRLYYFTISSNFTQTLVNQFLAYLCETSNIAYTGTIYVVDNLDMSVTYYFTEANFPNGLLTVIQDLNAMPNNAGVLINYNFP